MKDGIAGQCGTTLVHAHASLNYTLDTLERTELCNF